MKRDRNLHTMSGTCHKVRKHVPKRRLHENQRTQRTPPHTKPPERLPPPPDSHHSPVDYHQPQDGRQTDDLWPAGAAGGQQDRHRQHAQQGGQAGREVGVPGRGAVVGGHAPQHVVPQEGHRAEQRRAVAERVHQKTDGDRRHAVRTGTVVPSYRYVYSGQ